MKYTTGDRVRIIKLDRQGTVLNTEGTKKHPYYVSIGDGSLVADYFCEEDLEPSKIPRLTEEDLDQIITLLHHYAEQRQPFIFGLPIYNTEDMEKMRDMIRAVVSPASGLPERREQPRSVTELDKAVADEARLFEESIGIHPLRRPSKAHVWGWCYESDTLQHLFRDYCKQHNNRVTG